LVVWIFPEFLIFPESASESDQRVTRSSFDLIIYAEGGVEGEGRKAAALIALRLLI